MNAQAQKFDWRVACGLGFVLACVLVSWYATWYNRHAKAERQQLKDKLEYLDRLPYGQGK